MKLFATGDVPQQALDDFRANLPPDLQVTSTDVGYSLKSFDAPSWVRLVADLSWWQQALSAAAAVYVAELIKEAGKATWRSRAGLLAAVVEGAGALRTLAARLVGLKADVAPGTDVVVGLPETVDAPGTRLVITGQDAAEAELELALFAHYLPQVQQLIRAHADAGQRAAGGYTLEIQPDATLRVRWTDPDGQAPMEAVLSLAASPT